MLKRFFSRSGGTAVAEPIDVDATLEQIKGLTREHRADPGQELEREILRQRQLAGIGLAQRDEERRELIEPDYDGLTADAPVPEVGAEGLSAGVIRAAILRQGAILVRGLMGSEDALSLAKGIDQAFAAREGHEAGGGASDGYYEPLPAVPPNEGIPASHRSAVKEGGGVLAVDSPRVAVEMLDVFERVGVPEIVRDYLGEPPAISADKTTLRKADPNIPGGWHQDGKFLGDVNSLNLWVSLSHCGDTAPGMDLVPRRLDHIVEAGVGAEGFNRIVVTQEQAEELAGEPGIIRPIFEPGDAMFFDHLYLHKTASDPSMPNHRFAIESWFFGPSAFPEDYLALAL